MGLRIMGVQTLVWEALSEPGVCLFPGYVLAGVYLENCQVKAPSKGAQDMDMAAKLWAETERQLAVAEKKFEGS